ncbi:MAG: hypothetical protein ACK40X_00605 [Armatimonadota bacterium]
MAMSKFTIGLDFGTNSVRAVIVRVEDGEEVATSVWNYKRGEDGVIVDPKDPHLARQDPRDYVEGLEGCVKEAIAIARANAT